MIVLFLDLDGVLVPFGAHAELAERLDLGKGPADDERYRSHAHELFDARAVAALIDAIDQAGVTHVVVHSAWRNSEIDGSVPSGWIACLLRKVGLPSDLPIEVDFDGKGRTIDCLNRSQADRCDLVRAYLSLHRPRIKGYAVIDDLDLSRGLPDELRFVYVPHQIVRQHHSHALVRALGIRGGI